MERRTTSTVSAHVIVQLNQLHITMMTHRVVLFEPSERIQWTEGPLCLDGLDGSTHVPTSTCLEPAE